jgi:hypothetical protein
MRLRTLAQLVVPAVALTCLGPAGTSATASARTVLAVHWSSESFTGTQEMDAVIQEVLRLRSDRIDYFAEYLESDRFPDEEATLAFGDYIRRKFRGRRIDVVIAITDVALRFALRYRAELFPDAPIVFTAVAAPDTAIRSAGPGLTGVLRDLAARAHAPSNGQSGLLCGGGVGSRRQGLDAGPAAPGRRRRRADGHRGNVRTWPRREGQDGPG